VLAVNTALIDLYWQVGQTISQKIAQAQWGDGVMAHPHLLPNMKRNWQTRRCCMQSCMSFTSKVQAIMML